MDPESPNDALLDDHPQMITHALMKAFKPFFDEMNARVYTAYIIPDWFPLRIYRDKWDDESGHAGMIYVLTGTGNRRFIQINLDKEGYFNLRINSPDRRRWKNGRTRQFFAADPKSLHKIKNEIVDYLEGKVDEISLEDLPLGE